MEQRNTVNIIVQSLSHAYLAFLFFSKHERMIWRGLGMTRDEKNTRITEGELYARALLTIMQSTV